MKWIWVVAPLVMALFVSLVCEYGLKQRVNALTLELEAAKTELAVAHVEQATCELALDGCEQDLTDCGIKQRERDGEVVRGKCMFPCADLDCRDRCQSCYRLVTDVKESLKIRNGR
jgi:hypothetical protein